MALGENHIVTAVPELVFNTTPTNSDNWFVLRNTGGGPDVSYNSVNSEELNGQEVGLAASFNTGKDIAGSYNIELSFGSFDAFMEALFGGSWAADVLQCGLTKRSFSIQSYQPDLTTGDKYILYTGCAINQLQLNFEPKGEVVKGSIGFVCSGMSVNANDALGTGADPAEFSTIAMRSGDLVDNVRINGTLASTLGERVKSIGLNLSREQSGDEVVDSNSVVDLEALTPIPQVTVEAYLNNYNRLKSIDANEKHLLQLGRARRRREHV